MLVFINWNIISVMLTWWILVAWTWIGWGSSAESSLISRLGIPRGWRMGHLHLEKISYHIVQKCHNGILLPKLFWPTVRNNYSSDREKEISRTIYSNSERSVKQNVFLSNAQRWKMAIFVRFFSRIALHVTHFCIILVLDINQCEGNLRFFE